MSDINHYAKMSFEQTPQNEEESHRYANLLAQGNYPAGLDGCFTVGISGGCGLDCFVYQEEKCECTHEFLKNKTDMTEDDLKLHYELYGKEDI